MFCSLNELISFLHVNQSKERGTVKDKADFKVDEDVTALRKAIEGLGRLRSLTIHKCMLKAASSIGQILWKNPTNVKNIKKNY